MAIAAEQIKTYTNRCGVYCMFDNTDTIIYVGKAKNLKKRLASYFSNKQSQSPKTSVMMKRVEKIEVTVTHTENEALILENNLIKSYKPRYNISFRDDKSYPFIKLGAHHPYPRFSYHRGSTKGKAKYFGPYPSAAAVRSTLNLIQKLFLIRSCEDSVFANRSRPCLQYQIKRCSAPCVGLISKQYYQRDIDHAILFLQGNNEAVISALVEPMQQAAASLQFELAARFRDQIRALRDLQNQQTMTTHNINVDIISCVMLDGNACIQLMLIRGGMNLGSRHYFPEHATAQTEADLIKAFLSHLYLNNTPQKGLTEILLSHSFEDIAIMQTVLTEKIGTKIHIKTSARGKRAQWLALATENATVALQQQLANKHHQQYRFDALQKLLNMKAPIQRLECFDISHTQGEATVGSCVVFDSAGPVTAKYRQFNIGEITKGDDYAAMRQTIRRRYTRLVKEAEKLPEVIIIDGGKGQINAAKAELAELQLSHILILGLAKGSARKRTLEKLILATENKVLACDSTAPELHLLQHIRDEAHRFALTAHLRRRKKARNSSQLETVKGIGSKKRQALIKHFGGLQGIAKAGVAELTMVAGVNKQLAEKIYQLFHW